MFLLFVCESKLWVVKFTQFLNRTVPILVFYTFLLLELYFFLK
jgi:hypothetical protein